jgi:hypothetical protein
MLYGNFVHKNETATNTEIRDQSYIYVVYKRHDLTETGPFYIFSACLYVYAESEVIKNYSWSK